MSTHLLLEGPDLQDLLAQVRHDHGDAARVVRAERIRSGGVAGFFTKERYEVTVEIDDDGTAPAEAAPAETPAAGEVPDFEALLAAADRAESEAAAQAAQAVAAPAGRHAAPAGDEVQALQPGAAGADDFEEARQGLVEMLKASGAVSSARAAGLLEGSGAPGAEEVVEEVDLAAALAEAARREEERRLDEEAAAAELAEAQRREAELAEAERQEAERQEAERIEAQRQEAERREAELAEAQRLEAERLEAERQEAERIEAERAEAQRREAERLEAERVEAERAEAQRREAQRREAERLEAERREAQRRETERREAERRAEARREAEQREAERREAARAEAERREAERVQQERVVAERREAERAEAQRREAARQEVRRRQAERIERAGAPAPRDGERSLGDLLAAADAADGADRLRAMLSAGRDGAGRRRAEQAPQRPAVPHRPISTEGSGFAATMAAVRTLGDGRQNARPNVTSDVRSVTKQSPRPSGPRPGRPAAAAGADAPFGGLPARTTEDRVTPDQFGAANGVAPRRLERTDVPVEGRGRGGEQDGPATVREGFEARRGAPRRPELRRPAPVEDHFGDRFVEEDVVPQGVGGYAEDEYEVPFEPAGERRQAYPYAVPDDYADAREVREEPRHEVRAPLAPERTNSVAGERAAHDGDDNEAADMDLTYRDSVTTYSDRPAAARAPYREPHDSGDVLRLAREIEVPAPLRVGSGELVVVVGEADAVVGAALLVADEVGSEAPLVLGRADVQNTVTADELPARQEQARRWSAPLTVAVPARPTAADAERAARLAAEIGASAVVVCVDATRRSHAVAAQLNALESAGVPARRLAVHRAAESPDPLDVLSLDVPVGFLDGRPATSGAWAGLLLDATSGGGAAR
ncbi:hypothetical protein [Kineococcus sp. SYSU DK005]|uniref:hypothetical protein n=1 Tax=Kineococcus sp. SYSU DK005 TaxID=3383126 RepID=UPI003D7D39D9